MKRYGRYNNQGAGLAMLLVVVVLAVFSGYMGTKFIIEPYFLADSGTTPPAPEENGADGSGGTTDNSGGIVSGQQNVTDLPQGENTGDENTADKTAETTGAPDQEGLPEVQGQDDASLVTPQAEEGTVPTASPIAGGSLYCVQFGSFSTQDAAEKAVKELTEKDVATYVHPKEDGTYKVLSLPYESREKALEAAESIKDKVEDVYVVTM